VLRGLRLHWAGAFGDTVDLTQHLQEDGRNAQSGQMRRRRGRAFCCFFQRGGSAKRRVSRRRCIILTSLVWARKVDGDASVSAALEDPATWFGRCECL
jgi:hypothetical protein